MSSKFVACIGKGGQRDMAESFARRTGTTLLDKPGEELTVLFDAKGLLEQSSSIFSEVFLSFAKGMNGHSLTFMTADLRMKCLCAQLKQRRQM